MNQVLKILYITNGIDGSGGLEKVLSIKASILAEDPAYEVHILTLNRKNEQTFFTFSDQIKFHNINVSGNPLSYLRNYKAELRTAVGKIRPDIISVCDDGLKGFFVPSILQGKYRVIYERHASVLINSGSAALSKLKNKLQHRIMRSKVRTFDRFVVLTEGNRKEWEGDNIIVIPNPVDEHETSEAPSGLHHKTVIAVGSQSYNKGYDRLLEAWKRVQASHPEWRLNIFGKKNESLGLELQAETLGVKDSLTFYEPVKNIKDKYRESSIMVLPSRSEGFGMVLIEAMNCGLPCVSFDCPHGPRDIITDGIDGYLIPDGDIEGFAEKVSLLIDNDQMRHTFGAAALEKAKQYAPGRILDIWKNLFASLMQEKP